MSKAEDQLETGGAITDLVFDDNHHERPSWRFCNSGIPRSGCLSSCLYYISFYYNFSHNSFSGITCVFPAGM